MGTRKYLFSVFNNFLSITHTLQALEERNQKLKQEKESTTKSLKSMKTKLERASQMEEVSD